MVEELLKKFDFCLDYGFVIKDPLERLESYFDPWTELVLQLDDIRWSSYLNVPTLFISFAGLTQGEV